MEIRLPQLGEGADSGSVATIFVKEGDTIQKDDPIIELESEKAVASIPSPAAGTVGKIHVHQGDTVKVGQLLLTLAGAPAAGQPAGAPAQKPAQREPANAPQPAIAAANTADEPAAASAEPGAEPAAAPSIRRLARELGLDLRSVRGSERGGRIVMADLRAYLQRLQKQAAPAGKPAAGTPATEKIDFEKFGEIARKPMTPLRQTIARRMHESWTAIPHVTQFDEADITQLLELRKKHAAAYEAKGAHLTLTPFVLRALVGALKKQPLFNASLDEARHEIVLKEYFHFGIAVDTEHGLIVPVLRDVDKKSLLQLSQDLEILATKARDRKLTSDDLRGNTFTISNQGGIGGGQFTPIINRPDVAILGLGRATWQPVVTSARKIEARMLLPLCLSYDHRVVDGANAARFIVDLKQALEEFPEAEAKL